jgi:hypothetical protein
MPGYDAIVQEVELPATDQQSATRVEAKSALALPMKGLSSPLGWVRWIVLGGL